MSSSANTFTSLQPILKVRYADEKITAPKRERKKRFSKIRKLLGEQNG